jgi:hypothetical protein
VTGPVVSGGIPYPLLTGRKAKPMAKKKGVPASLKAHTFKTGSAKAATVGAKGGRKTPAKKTKRGM